MDDDQFFESILATENNYHFKSLKTIPISVYVSNYFSEERNCAIVITHNYYSYFCGSNHIF